MQIKGKKLSVTQRNILRKALFEDKITADLDNFLLKKIKHVSADGSSRPSRLKGKYTVYELINKYTGNILEVSVGKE